MTHADADWLGLELAEHGAELRDGRPLSAGVRRQLSPRAAGRLRRTAFAVLRPDALHAGSAAALLDELGARFGASVLGLRVRMLSPADFNALYKHELTLMGRKVWLHHRLFGSGPAALVLLEGDPGGFATFSERLRAVKGDASPAQTDTTDLRSSMGRMSAVHVGLHTADDIGAVICQSTLFFGVAGLARLLDEPDPLEPEVWRALLDTELPADATVPAAVLRLKLRILANLIASAPDSREPARDLRTLTTGTLTAIGGWDYRRQREGFREFARAEHPLLQALIRGYEDRLPARAASILSEEKLAAEVRSRELQAVADTLHTLYASWYLSGHDAYTAGDGEELFQALDRCNVPTTEHLRILVMAGLQYDVNPSATWSAERIYVNDWSAPGDE